MSFTEKTRISVVVPAYNEGPSVAGVVLRLRDVLEKARIRHEIIVVDDGSDDNTAHEAERVGAEVVRSPTNKGYGYSLLSGIKRARYPLIAITDADETYPSEMLPELIKKAERYDMVIGQRTGKFYQGSRLKSLSRVAFRVLSEFTAGARIPDINSGLRVFSRDFVLEHENSISTGYSFTTTVTLIALLEGHHLLYVPIEYHQRAGESKVRYVRDTLRSLQIITQVILAYNPIKFFMLLAIIPLIVVLFQAAFWLAYVNGVIPEAAFEMIEALVLAIYVSLIIFTVGGVSFTINATLKTRNSKS